MPRKIGAIEGNYKTPILGAIEILVNLTSVKARKSKNENE